MQVAHRTESYEGGCLCGALRFRATGTATNLACCHCRSCRLHSGAPFMAWATFERARFELLSGELREFESSRRAIRGGCAVCGTAISYKPTARGSEIDVSLATLDEPNALAPEMHIWTAHKLAWLVLGDGLPQYEEWKPLG